MTESRQFGWLPLASATASLGRRVSKATLEGCCMGFRWAARARRPLSSLVYQFL